MIEEALAGRAADGLSLSGAYFAPEEPRATIVWIHGFGVSYDLPQCAQLGRALSRVGLAFVAAGLRSQHGAYTGWRDRDGRTSFMRAGGWYEVFEESTLDLSTWVAIARGRSPSPVILAGHSFGALRAAYYVAERSTPTVDALILGSFSYGLRHLEADVSALATSLVEAGRGSELLFDGSWARGFGTTTVSAQTYASWSRVAGGFFDEGAPTLAAVNCPTFVWYGTKEDVGGAAELDWLRGRLTSAPLVEQALLPDVSHGYLGGEQTIADAIAGRVETLVGVAALAQ